MPDLINGAFELFGGVFILLNILQLLKDKQVKGIHWGSSIFFTSWGLWNCWYYPHLDQWASFAGGVVICILNVVWLTLRVRYWKARPAIGPCTRKPGHSGPCNGLPCRTPPHFLGYLLP